MQGVIDFFDKHDERPDVAIGQSATRVVLFELFNQPARIINTDVSWSPARRRNVRASSLNSRADFPASTDNCAQRVRSIKQSSRLIPTCAYVRSNNFWIWLNSVSFINTKSRQVGTIRRAPECGFAVDASRSQTKRRARVLIEIEQTIGKLVQREPHVAKSIG